MKPIPPRFFVSSLLTGAACPYGAAPALPHGNKVSAGYHYLRLEGADFSASVAGIDPGEVDVDDVTFHEILIGLRYTF